MLSIRKKEKIKVRQPLKKVLIPALDSQEKQAIVEVSDLIAAEVNVKTIEILDDASSILVKEIKPNFKTLGPRFGKEMKYVSEAIQALNDEQIQSIEKQGAVAIEKDEVVECGIRQNLKIVDLTGAGDLFAAGFLHGHVNNMTLKESLDKGSEMSSKVIQQIGARL